MGVSVSFMKRKVASGEVASFTWGRMRLIPVEALWALMEGPIGGARDMT
jgi:hypothetical protein